MKATDSPSTSASIGASSGGCGAGRGLISFTSDLGSAACHLTWRVQLGNQVELLIPQLQFLDDKGAQAELWELSRIFLDTLIEETGCQKVRAIFLDARVAILLKYRWEDAAFGFSSLSDRKPVESQDRIIVMVVPD
ncbi:hypothetical protein PTKIN_Ptkin13bG0015400 [Pterospermum kingtungense]